ncbi:MAG: hypothetical protein H7256_12575, partial [Bdellovibrio sp.]|nr:hypothetical protein [Bdellovibrio sp.]
MIKISEKKITAIKQKIPNLELSFFLSKDFSATVENYRENIRTALAHDHSFHFNR